MRGPRKIERDTHREGDRKTETERERESDEREKRLEKNAADGSELSNVEKLRRDVKWKERG